MDTINKSQSSIPSLHSSSLLCPFFSKLGQRQNATDSLLCVGLDPDISKFPAKIKTNNQSVREKVFSFNKTIIDATAPYTGTYKPQSAFYEGLGIEGIQALFDTIAYLKKTYPDIPVILDAKRGDIGSTNAGYVAFAFDHLGADALTINPYLGKEAMQPFLDRSDKALVVLTKTSNPGAGEFQDLLVDLAHLPSAFTQKYGDLSELESLLGFSTVPLNHVIAYAATHSWNANKNIALVVGATYPEELVTIRKIVGEDIVFLIPGIGAQGGSISDSLSGLNAEKKGAMLSVSRSVLYASVGDDFAQAAANEAKRLRDEINKYRQQ